MSFKMKCKMEWDKRWNSREHWQSWDISGGLIKNFIFSHMHALKDAIRTEAHAFQLHGHNRKRVVNDTQGNADADRPGNNN